MITNWVWYIGVSIGEVGVIYGVIYGNGPWGLSFGALIAIVGLFVAFDADQIINF